MAVYRPIDFGAAPDGDPDVNRDAFQNAINACSTVGQDELHVTPPGRFTLSKQPNSNPWCVLGMGRNIRWRHDEGAEVAMRFDQANQTVPFGNHNALLYLWNYPGFTLENAQMFGNKIGAGGVTDYQEAPEHHRAVFCREGTGLRVLGGYYHDFTGDGIQLYNNCLDSLFDEVTMRWCQRDHITLSPTDPATAVRGVMIRNCWLEGASNQNVDNEHGPAHDVTIVGCTLIFHPNNSSSGICIAGSGTTISDPSTNWDIDDNNITGCIRFTWTSFSKIRRNRIINERRLSAIELERGQTGNLVDSNIITMTAPMGTANLAGIYLNGTAGGGSADATLRRNQITISGNPQSFGIRADGVVSLRAIENILQGTGVAAAGYSAMRVRATVPDRDVEWAVFHRNVARDFGASGITVASNPVFGKWARIRHLEAVQNRFENTLPGGPMKTGLALSDSLNTLRAGLAAGNEFGTGITTQVVAAASPRVAYSFSALSPGPAALVSERGRGAGIRERGRGAEIGGGRTLRAEAA
jgi:hypothetical protein